MRKTLSIDSIILCLATLFSLGFMNSCTVYYKTSDIEKSFATVQKESNKSLKKLAKDRREKRGIYTQIMISIEDTLQNPYPQLATLLHEMGTDLGQVKQTNDELQTLQTKFTHLTAGKKKIETKTSLWKDYQKIRSEYDSLTEVFQSAGDSYTKSSNKFATTLNKYKISRIKVPDLKKQVLTYIDELDQALTTLAAEISKSRSLLASNSKGANRKKSASRNERLNQMEAILTEIQNQQSTMRQLVSQFEDEIGDKTLIWSGPGMQSYTIVNEMTKLGDETRRLGEKFNKIAKDLK